MDDNEQTNYDSDMSDDLPDLFDAESMNSEHPQSIAKGDVVWAKFRSLYWPALVRSVAKKKRKVSLWYLDSPRKTFHVPFRHILNFSNPVVNQRIKTEVQASPMKAQHDRVLNWTLCFIHRKANGIKDDPGKYFDLTRPYLSFLNFPSPEKDSDITRFHYLGETTSSDFNEEESNFSDDESSVDSRETERSFLHFHPELYNSGNVCDEDKADVIVACVTSGETDIHLLNIMSHKTPCERQSQFDNAMKTNNRHGLMYLTPSVIFNNREKLKTMSYYLLNFYEKKVEGGKCEMFSYINSVWLPEAIDKAIAMIDTESWVPTVVPPKVEPYDIFPKRRLFLSHVDVNTSTSDVENKKTDPTIDDSTTSTSCVGKKIKAKPNKHKGVKKPNLVKEKQKPLKNQSLPKKTVKKSPRKPHDKTLPSHVDVNTSTSDVENKISDISIDDSSTSTSGVVKKLRAKPKKHNDITKTNLVREKQRPLKNQSQSKKTVEKTSPVKPHAKKTANSCEKCALITCKKKTIKKLILKKDCRAGIDSPVSSPDKTNENVWFISSPKKVKFCKTDVCVEEKSTRILRSASITIIE